MAVYLDLFDALSEAYPAAVSGDLAAEPIHHHATAALRRPLEIAGKGESKRHQDRHEGAFGMEEFQKFARTEIPGQPFGRRGRHKPSDRPHPACHGCPMAHAFTQ